MSAVLEVPFVVMAERAVIGSCVDTDAGYRLAASRLVADDFYKPAHRALFQACGQLGHLDGIDLDTIEERVSSAARIAAVPTAEVAALVAERPVMCDRSGSFAAKVKRAALDRAAMSTARRLYNALAAGDRHEAEIAMTELRGREVA
jgi:replicative DNA helicase